MNHNGGSKAAFFAQRYLISAPDTLVSRHKSLFFKPALNETCRILPH